MPDLYRFYQISERFNKKNGFHLKITDARSLSHARLLAIKLRKRYCVFYPNGNVKLGKKICVFTKREKESVPFNLGK